MTTCRYIRKWDKASKSFDSGGAIGVERRYGKIKRELFSKATGKVLLVAAGTGQDFRHFPAGLEITAVDFSQAMLEKAKLRLGDYMGTLRLVNADAQALAFHDNAFDTVVTSCTFCSVPDPVKGLEELRRVLKPEGKMLMFEHVRPANILLGTMMDVMTRLSRFFGPDLNRRTGDNLQKAGFDIVREANIYLDVVKIFEVKKD
jgi:ubiquinone/menaquinone biosynthesis C-methylase UbiE